MIRYWLADTLGLICAIASAPVVVMALYIWWWADERTIDNRARRAGLRSGRLDLV